MVSATFNTPASRRRRWLGLCLLCLLPVVLASAWAATAPESADTPPVLVSVLPLDLGTPPTDEALSAAGQLGGALHPVESPTPMATTAGGASRRAAQNLDFGAAIQRWNAHEWKEATGLFSRHLSQYPNSPWADEAEIHLACEARYQGRYNEAEERYSRVLVRTKDNADPGARRLANKARLRLGESKTLRNNPTAAIEYFGELEKNGLDWRERTYAGHWLHRLQVQKGQELAFLNCGYLALGTLLAERGEPAGAREVLSRQAKSLDGQSLAELKDLAGQYGLNLNALRLNTAELDRIPLPAIVHIPGQAEGDKGHYWILQSKRGDLLRLHDPQSGRWFRQSVAEFGGEWQGVALVFADGKTALPGVPLAETELADLTGGCCGAPRPESDQGDPDADPKDDTANEPPGDKDDCGECFWSVNPINMNLYASDMPLWYDPAIGPKVGLKLSYNSQSAMAQHEPFGNKWQFNYGTYLVVDPGDTVLVYMPDGRRDLYTGDGQGNYTAPSDVYNRLANLGGQRWELRFQDDSYFIYDLPAGTGSMQPFLVELGDAHGQKLTFGYNAAVQLTTITDAQGQVTRFAYNATGLVETVTDPFGRTAGFQYDANRNLTQITDMGGYWSRLAYDANVYLTSIEKADGTWRFWIEPSTVQWGNSDNYPPPGDVMWANYRITITNPAGQPEEWFYYGGCDAYGCSGYTWYVSPRFYIPWQSQQVNNFRSNPPKTRFIPDRYTGIKGQIGRIIYPGQGEESYQYDSRGNVTQVTRPDGGVFQYTYNVKGQVTSVTDPKATVTTLVYAANGVDLLSVTDGRGTIRYEYNDRHQVTKVTDRLGNATTLAYNNFGQLTQTVAGAGTPIALTTVLIYGADQRLARVERAGQVFAQLTYDNFGRLRTQTDAAGLTLTHDYDALDQPTRIGYPDGRSEQFTWSSARPFQLVQETSRGGKVNRFTYDPEKRRTASIAPDGGLTRQLYDPDGNLTKLLDANSNPTTFGYDADNLVTAETYADGKVTTYTHDASGRVQTRTNARGIQTTYGYDLNGNLTAIDYADETPDVAFVYDAYNRVIQRTDGLGVNRFTYDGNDNLLTVDGPWDNDTIVYTFDTLGRRIGMNAQGGTPVSYTYDALGRLATVTQGARTYTLTYQGVSNLIARLTRPNGSYSTYTNDSLQRLTSLAHYKSDGTLITSYAYIYNGDDNRATETITNGLPMVSLDPKLETFQINNLNQVTGATSPVRDYQYDADGNMTQGYTSQGRIWNASYDAKNRLKHASFSTTDGLSNVMEIDYFGNDRAGRIRNYLNNVLIDDKKLIYDGFMTIQDRGIDNTPEREYLWRDPRQGGIGRLLSLNQNIDVFDYILDGRNNVILLLNTTQSVSVKYRYSSYGKIISKSGNIDQPFSYMTKRLYWMTGFSDFGFRFYSNVDERWLSRDPIGILDDYNLYLFVGSNPINKTDPLGLFRFGKRPLQGSPWLGPLSSNPLDDYFNTEISHEHGFFEDAQGGNIGFGPGGRFSEDPAGRGYRCDDTYYDDSIMREALNNVEDGEYSLFGNNCQDWADRLREEYRKIKERRRAG